MRPGVSTRAGRGAAVLSLVVSLGLLAGAHAGCPFAKMVGGAGGEATPGRKLLQGCLENPLVPPTPRQVLRMPLPACRPGWDQREQGQPRSCEKAML